MKKFSKILSICLSIILAVFLFSCSSCSTYEYDYASEYKSGNVEYLSSDYSSVSVLDLDWISGEVEIILSNANALSIMETSSQPLTEEEKLHTLIKNGTLYVKFAKSGWHENYMPEKKLTIAVPSRFSFDTINSTTVSTDLRVSGQYVRVFNHETVSGEVEINSCNVTGLTINSVSGDIRAENTVVGKFNGETVSGSLKFAFLTMTNQFKFNSVSGDVILSIPQNSSFTAYFETVSGRFINNYGGTFSNGNLSQNGGNSIISVETVSSNLTINSI